MVRKIDFLLDALRPQADYFANPAVKTDLARKAAQAGEFKRFGPNISRQGVRSKIWRGNYFEGSTMKRVLIVVTFALLGTCAIAQDYVDPKAATRKAQEDAWATAVKAKAADEAAVAAKKKAEVSKVPPETKLEVRIYDGKGGKTIGK